MLLHKNNLINFIQLMFLFVQRLKCT